MVVAARFTSEKAARDASGDSKTTPKQMIYRITVKERLKASWSRQFDPLEITYNRAGNTILVGPIQDQAVLHGVLERIRDFNLTLISVDRLEDQAL